MGSLKRIAFLAASSWPLVVLSGLAFAAGPRDGQLGFQAPVTPTMEEIVAFHDLLLVIITVIAVFVLLLMLYVMFRFSERRNPTPSKTTHNTVVEVVWTVVPIIILVVIAIPSFKLLYFADRVENPDLVVKAVGKQWYWSYEYPDNGNFTFDSYMLSDDELEEGQPRLLAADNAMVLPVETNIEFLITAGDVLHNFAVPAFGIKLDGVPGRINRTWAFVPQEYAGETFYGQCSELCGTGHAYMPIMVKMVTKEEFAEWTAWAREEYAQVESPDLRLADGGRAGDTAE